MLLAGNLHSQIKINSPYSRYGLGWLVENRFETRIMGMGGIRFGVQHPTFVNPANPASYAAFDSTSFIFQGGVFGTSVQLKTDQLTENSNFMSMSHLLFGFPVMKWWRTSFGVLPFSYVGYDVIVDQEVEEIGDARYFFQGSGGFNKLFWGNAFKITKRLSVGFNAAYLFGTIYRENGIGFPENVYLRNTRTQTAMTAKDFYLDFGIQYYADIRDKYRLTMGMVYGNQTNISAKQSYLVTAYYGDINSVQPFYDTIAEETREDGYFVLPAKIGGGLTFGENGRWLVGADFRWQNWEKSESFGVSDSLRNSWTIAVGGEITPDPNSILSYWNTVSYRAGFNYSKTYLSFNGIDVNEIGISFGLGFPLPRTKTTLNLTLVAGKKGTIDDGLIQENFIRFTFGVNIFETWFIKSKYF